MAMNPRLLKPTASAFSPRSISGLALWLDASDSGSTFTTDAGPVVAVTDPRDIAGCQLWLDASDASTITASGGEVTAWADKSATGSTWTIPSGFGGPTTGSTTLGGKNALLFDGVNDVLKSSNNPLGTALPLTFFIVQRIIAPTNFGTSYVIVPSTKLIIRQVSTFGWVDGFVGGLSDATNRLFRDDRNRTGLTDICTIVFPSGAGTTNTAVVNGAGLATTNSTLKPDVQGDHYIGCRLAFDTTPEQFANIAVAEIIAFNTALTTAQRASVEAYLATKWAISGVHTPATASSDPVGYWGDKSGNGRHAVQATAGSRPLVGTQNGRKALTFDGTNDSLRHIPSTAIGSTGLTIIAALKHNLTSQPYYLSQPLSLTATGAGRPLERWQGGASESIAMIGNGSTNVGGSYRQQPDRFVYSIDAAKDFISSGTHQLREFLNGATNFDILNTGVWTTSSQRINVGARDDGATQYKGDICELFAYDRRLTTAERQRAERYLAARWGITLAPQVSNLDAQDWINRVYQNGGTVSTATAAAVNSLCESLESASLRDRFYRLNIFAGGNLNAALVPLYLTPDKTVTNLFQYGTDMSNAAWQPGGNGAVTRAISTEVGPLGYGYATKLTTPSSPFDVRQMHQYLPAQNRQVTLSVWLKTNTGTRQVQWMINGDYLDTFTVTSTWTRYTKTHTSTVSAADGRTGISTVSELSDAAGFIFAWGMQCEYGATATSYNQPRYGNTTDTNVGGLFVTANYNETGASGGLQGASASSKRLRTGLAQDAMPTGDLHIAAYEIAKSNASSDTSVGARNNSLGQYSELAMSANTSTTTFYNVGTGFASASDSGYTQAGGFLLGVSASTALTLYKNGSSAATGTVSAAASTSSTFAVFATETESGTGADFSNARLGGYSIGLSMDAGQAAAYNTAMQSFQAALTRNV